MVSTSTARVSPFDTSSNVASFCWLLSLGGALRGETMARVSPPGLAALSVRLEIATVGSRIGICRTIVAASGVRRTLECDVAGVGTPNDSSRNPTLPNANVSSLVARPFSVFDPFTKVPLLEPRSRSSSTLPSEVSSAWRREMSDGRPGCRTSARAPR